MFNAVATSANSIKQITPFWQFTIKSSCFLRAYSLKLIKSNIINHMYNFQLFLKENEKIRKAEREWNAVLKKIIALRSKKPAKSIRISTNQLAVSLEQVTIGKLKNRIGKNKFINITGPSGVGKGTLGAELEKYGFLHFARATTRPKRPQEKNGVDYLFISDNEFLKRKKNKEFIGGFQTYGEWRAIPKQKFFELLKKNKKFYIDGCAKTSLDILNCSLLDKTNFLTLFILPPNFTELVNRLVKRSIEERAKKQSVDPKKILKRLITAISHLKESVIIHNKRFVTDGYIVNDKVQKAVQKILKLL